MPKLGYMFKKMSYLLLNLFLLIIPNMAVMASSLKTEEEQIAYSLGYVAGEHLRSQQKEGIIVDPEVFIQGFKDSIRNKSQLNEEQIIKSLNIFKAKQLDQSKKNLQSKSDINLKIAKEFLEQNKQNNNIIELASGLQYEVIDTGDKQAISPKLNDKVQVEYRGIFLNGAEFDSSYGREQATIFELNSLIKGWQEALLLMKPNDKWRIFVPPELAYGTDGSGSIIEPNSALIFEIKLVAINPT